MLVSIPRTINKYCLGKAEVKASTDHNEVVLSAAEVDYGETPTEGLPAPIRHDKVEDKTTPEKDVDEDPYYQTDKRKWLDTKTEPTGMYGRKHFLNLKIGFSILLL